MCKTTLSLYKTTKQLMGMLNFLIKYSPKPLAQYTIYKYIYTHAYILQIENFYIPWIKTLQLSWQLKTPSYDWIKKIRFLIKTNSSECLKGRSCEKKERERGREEDRDWKSCYCCSLFILVDRKRIYIIKYHPTVNCLF